jgi:hypothetical protein
MPNEPARAVAIGIVLVALFSFFFVYPGHDPEPNDLPVAVVGGEAPTPEGVDVVRADDTAEAREMILDREVYGALTPEGVLVASAASFQVAQNLAGLAEGQQQRVVEIRPLDADDPRGVSLNLTLLPLTVTAILGAMLGFTLAPRLEPARRLMYISAFAVLGALVSMLIVRVGIGALPGNFLALTAVAALGMFALATVSVTLMLALGPPGIMASFLLFLMLGNPASGAASAPELLPDPWSRGGQFLPPGALGTGLRNVAYFDGADAALWLGVLVVWAAIGVAALFAVRRPAPGPPSPEPAGI